MFSTSIEVPSEHGSVTHWTARRRLKKRVMYESVLIGGSATRRTDAPISNLLNTERCKLEVPICGHARTGLNLKHMLSLRQNGQDRAGARQARMRVCEAYACGAYLRAAV